MFFGASAQGLGTRISDPLLSPSEAETRKRAAIVDSYIAEALPFLQDYRLSALRRLAPVISERTEWVAIPGDDNQDPVTRNQKYKVLVLKFKGLEIKGVNYEGKLSPLLVEITSEKWVLKDGLAVGKKIEVVEERLGKGDVFDGHQYFYGGDERVIQFFVANGLVKKIVLY
jgi:hypothetical protein